MINLEQGAGQGGKEKKAGMREAETAIIAESGRKLAERVTFKNVNPGSQDRHFRPKEAKFNPRTRVLAYRSPKQSPNDRQERVRAQALNHKKNKRACVFPHFSGFRAENLLWFYAHRATRFDLLPLEPV